MRGRIPADGTELVAECLVTHVRFEFREYFKRAQIAGVFDRPVDYPAAAGVPGEAVAQWPVAALP